MGLQSAGGPAGTYTFPHIAAFYGLCGGGVGFFNQPLTPLYAPSCPEK